MEKSEVLKKCIEKYGKVPQLVVAMEECSELIKECSKEIRGKGSIDNIIEEMADVYIMLKQLQMIMGISDKEIENEISFKISRMEKRLISKDMNGD